MAKTPIQPPAGVQLSRLHTIKSSHDAHKFIAETLSVPVSLNYVRAAAAKRDIPCVKRGHALYFSTQGLFDWVVSTFEHAHSNGETA